MVDIVYRLPNYLTILRLFLIPVFVFLLHNPTRLMINLALIVFIFAAITDYIDGFIARRWGVVSEFGKLLDPIADKILVISALIMLTSLRSDLYASPWVPGWMVVLVVAREVWITGLRALAASKGKIIAANSGGKWKSFLQMFAVICLLLHDYEFPIFNYLIPYQIIGLYLLTLSLVFSYLSAISYTKDILAPNFRIELSPASYSRSTDHSFGDNLEKISHISKAHKKHSDSQ